LPVNSIVKTANNIIKSNSLKERIPIEPNAHEDELHNLSLTLNNMLDRIDDVVAQEKRFTSDASHELRTPISVILAQGEYLLDIAKDEKERELAEDIVFEANKLTLLVERLLLLARIDNNRQKLDKKETDLHSVIDNVISAQSEFAIQKNITFQVELGQAYKMFADEALITSAIGNLVNNAIKYGIAGGYVKISAFDSDDGINITIKDNGIGISKENIDKIWTRFFKIDDVRNDEYGSCGMGLSMVKSIIDLHDGKIDVNSVFGEGTEFTIILPNR